MQRTKKVFRLWVYGKQNVECKISPLKSAVLQRKCGGSKTSNDCRLLNHSQQHKASWSWRRRSLKCGHKQMFLPKTASAKYVMENPHSNPRKSKAVCLWLKRAQCSNLDSRWKKISTLAGVGGMRKTFGVNKVSLAISPPPWLEVIIVEIKSLSTTWNLLNSWSYFL